MFSINIEKETLRNKYYRKVLYTDEYQQLVVMSLKPGEYIPLEMHSATQFFRIEQGRGVAQSNAQKVLLKDGVSLIVPPKTKHIIRNTGAAALKLYTIYSPPQHPRNTLNKIFISDD